MKLLRIKAVYSGNEKEYVILMLLEDDNDNIITTTEMFGYFMDDDEEGLSKKPFIINATMKKNYLSLNYGKYLGYAEGKIFLPKKVSNVNEYRKLTVKEYFTRREENDPKEYLYEIETIEEIIS